MNLSVSLTSLDPSWMGGNKVQICDINQKRHCRLVLLLLVCLDNVGANLKLKNEIKNNYCKIQSVCF